MSDDVQGFTTVTCSCGYYFGRVDYDETVHVQFGPNGCTWHSIGRPA